MNINNLETFFCQISSVKQIYIFLTSLSLCHQSFLLTWINGFFSGLFSNFINGLFFFYFYAIVNWWNDMLCYLWNLHDIHEKINYDKRHLDILFENCFSRLNDYCPLNWIVYITYIQHWIILSFISKFLSSWDMMHASETL